MVGYLRTEREKMPDHKLTISVELEKANRPELDSLFALGDVVFISKDVAMSKGFTDMESAVRGLKNKTLPGLVRLLLSYKSNCLVLPMSESHGTSQRKCKQMGISWTFAYRILLEPVSDNRVILLVPVSSVYV